MNGLFNSLTFFERGLLAHLIADWLLQNNWMATNKQNLRHPAAWIHSGIYTICLGIAVGWLAGIVLGVIHILIDTRLPLRWWQGVIGQTREGPAALITAIWADQALHIVLIGLWVGLVMK